MGTRKKKNSEIELENIIENTTNKEEQEINIIIWDKKYSISYLLEILKKENKRYFEIELSKKFKLLIQNYFVSIRHILGGQYLNVKEVKEELQRDESKYSIIDIKCSRGELKFSKEIVNIILKVVEEYQL